MTVWSWWLLDWCRSSSSNNLFEMSIAAEMMEICDSICTALQEDDGGFGAVRSRRINVVERVVKCL